MVWRGCGFRCPAGFIVRFRIGLRIDELAHCKDYRNYIHPQKELSHGISLTTLDAQISWEAGKSISRQLLQ